MQTKALLASAYVLILMILSSCGKGFEQNTLPFSSQTIVAPPIVAMNPEDTEPVAPELPTEPDSTIPQPQGETNLNGLPKPTLQVESSEAGHVSPAYEYIRAVAVSSNGRHMVVQIVVQLTKTAAYVISNEVVIDQDNLLVPVNNDKKIYVNIFTGETSATQQGWGLDLSVACLEECQGVQLQMTLGSASQRVGAWFRLAKTKDDKYEITDSSIPEQKRMGFYEAIESIRQGSKN